MRNIFRVVLWKLPPSFCALAQRSGRAVRDFEQLGEAILFVSAKVLKDGLAVEEARVAREEAAEPQNQEGEDFVAEPEEGVDVVAGQAVVVGEGGARVELNAEAEEADPEVAAAAQKKRKRKAARQSASDALGANFLTRYACSTSCRRLVWDEYFKNNLKGESYGQRLPPLTSFLFSTPDSHHSCRRALLRYMRAGPLPHSVGRGRKNPRSKRREEAQVPARALDFNPHWPP
jgi:hypothetical protein